MPKPAPTRRNTALLKAIRELIPRASLAEFETVSEIALRGHLRHLPPTVVAWQAVTTHARHNHTDYDELLKEGYDPESARHFVADDIDEVLEKWGCPRRLDRSADN